MPSPGFAGLGLGPYAESRCVPVALRMHPAGSMAEGVTVGDRSMRHGWRIPNPGRVTPGRGSMMER